MLIHLLSRINRDIFNVSVCSLVGKGILTKEVEKLGFEAENLQLNSPLQIHKVLKLYKCLKKQPFDLIHIYGLRADVPGRFLAKKAGIPVVISAIRSTDPWRKCHHVKLDRLTLRWADFFISNSKAGKESRIHRERYQPSLIDVIHNGIAPPPDFTKQQKKSFLKKYGIPDQRKPVVCMIANLRIMKGHRDVIRAMKKIIHTFPDIMFIFAGRDDSGGKVPELADHYGVMNNIKFTGYCPDPAEILSVSDAFILPSHWEGCPTSLIEAMSFGLPCIASRVGGIPEIVTHDHDGVLIPPKKPSAVADSLVSLLKNPEKMKNLGDSARATYRKKFTVDEMVKKHERIYAELIEARKCR